MAAQETSMNAAESSMKATSTIPTIEILAQEYRDIIDWARFYRLTQKLGNQCNERMDRMDKGEIIERAIACYSKNNRIRRINGEGCDFEDTHYNISIEGKYALNCLFTHKKHKNIIRAKIKNSLGKIKEEIQKPADYYMFIQENAAAIISYENMRPYLIVGKDSIDANIPFEKITLYHRMTVTLIVKNNCN
jgi:hypothetical protein